MGVLLQLDIEEKVRLAKDTEVKISSAREVYRPVATRGSLLYFLIDNINTLDRVYHYSMANFIYILRKGMDVTPGGPDQSKVPEDQRLEEEVPLEARVKLLIDTTSYEIFQYVAQGLFERHKLIVATQLCMAILRQQGKLNAAKLEFLLKGPRAQVWLVASVPLYKHQALVLGSAFSCFSMGAGDRKSTEGVCSRCCMGMRDGLARVGRLHNIARRPSR